MLINLTPHEVTFLVGRRRLSLPPAEAPARCRVSRKVVDYFGEIPITRSVFGEVENLPEPAAGVRYIVSRIVAEACPQRTDLYIPDDTVRDEQGRIVGCRALAQVCQEREEQERGD